MLPGTRAQSYPGIDLLRALAALLVVAYHVIEYGKWTAVPNTGFGYVLRHGWVGVDLFLVISGFVIALSALDGHAREGVAFRRRFAVRRLARIVPLYFLTCAVYLFLVNPWLLGMVPERLATHVFSHLFFVHNLHWGTHGSINGPTWSVALEMQFYLLVFLVTPWLSRQRAWHVLAGALAVAMLWRFGTTLVWEPPQPDSTRQFVPLTQLPGVIDEFGFGIALALVVHRHDSRLAAWLAPGWRQCLGWGALAASLLVAAAATDRTFNQWADRGMLVAWRPLLAAGFAALLATAMTLPVAGHRILAPARYLGDLSYGIYLWHMPVLLSVTHRIPSLQGFWLLDVTLTGTLVLAACTWHLLEKPNLEKYKGAAPARANTP